MSKGAPQSRWNLPAAPMEALLERLKKKRSQGLWSIAWQRLRKDRTTWFAFVFLLCVGGLSLLAPVLPLPSPIAMHIGKEPLPPQVPWSAEGRAQFEPQYWTLSSLDKRLVGLRQLAFKQWQTGPYLGTDSKGRDLLSRLVWGSRTSLFVALAAALTSLVIGVLYGGFAGLVGGPVDRIMMRIVDALYALPFTFVVIFALGLLGSLHSVAGIGREAVFFIAIGALYWLTMARVVRGQVLSLKRSEFVLAARAQGAGPLRILFTHVVPNVLSVVVVYLTLTIPSVMLSEAFLSFLGLGVEPPKVSWGLLAVDALEAASPLNVYWWLILFPALAIGCVLLALNMLGDGLRDALDPHSDRRGVQT
ncbi:MAG TPA: ABC transporter permease [Planctomycetota bacterium]|nr:ABC transporter permease [Planctomycetota bacterium]